jgi:hypothetical protein
MEQREGLSEHEVMRDQRLPMWGRWGRQDSNRPDNERGSSSIYLMGRADRQGEQIIDGEIEVQDDPVPKLDTKDAEYLDGYIAQLSELHKQIIRQKYYKRLPVHRLDVDAAVRALLDEIANNRRVTDVMKRMGWT